MALPIDRSAPPSPQSLLLDRPPAAGENRLLQQLQQQGGFRAQVLLAEGRQILLDTAFGQLRGQLAPSAGGGTAPLLQPGDRIDAQLTPNGEQPPRLVIRRHQPLERNLQQPELRRLLEQTPNRLLAARVLESGKEHTLIQAGRQAFRLPAEPRLQPGDTVLLRPAESRGEIRVQRVQVLPLLRQALGQLLPRQAGADPQPGAGLGRLQQLIRQWIAAAPREPASGQNATQPGMRSGTPTPPASSDPGTASARTAPPGSAPASPPAPVSTPAAGNRAGPAEAAQPKAPAPASQTTPAATTATPPKPGPSPATTALPERLQSLLQPLLRAIVEPAQLTPQKLQQTLELLGLQTRPPLPGASPAAAPAPAQADLLPRLIELQALLRDQPELFERLLRDRPGVGEAAAKADPGAADDWPQWRQQFGQQLEQSINQLMLGKTGLRLQQEQQQPLNLNLAIPLQLPGEPQRELKLRLRERANPDDPEQPAWEVRLSFKFGLLGLITVHLLLQERRISAQFWAVEDGTRNLIDEQLPAFRQQLLRSGFEPGLFDCYAGQPLDSGDEPPAKGADNLLDVQV